MRNEPAKTSRLLHAHSVVAASVAWLIALLLVLATPASAAYVFQAKWGGYGGASSQLYYPFGVATDASGNVYVADSYNDRIQKFNPDGGFLTTLSPAGQLNHPYGVDVDGSGNVYVADTNNHRILKLNSAGGTLASWGTHGSGSGAFAYPAGVTADSGVVYVADTDNNRIQKFDSNGAYMGQWGTSGASNGQFAFPHGVATDGSGNVYVADSFNNRIQKFDSGGAFLAKWGSGGVGDGQFAQPYGITVDGSGNVYVADFGNDRIQKFTSGGGFLAKWGSRGSGDGQFLGPAGVAVDGSGRVYASDRSNHRIQRFGEVQDTTPPDTTIDSSPPALSANAHPTFTFHSSEGGSTFECSLDGGSWAAGCTSPKSYDIGDGNHTFRVRATDADGNTDPIPASSTFTIDTTAPTDPTPSSSSHGAGVASSDQTIDVAWSGASDAGSGVDGFSYEWSTAATTVPDTGKEAEEGAGAATSSTLNDGSNHYFHIRTRDNAGNWSSARHLGPFVIDTQAPADPTLSSTSHTVGVASSDRTVDASWSGASDERSGIDGFSYLWNGSPTTVPDTSKEAEEGAGGATSPTSSDTSSLYFHIRTRDNAGNWSSARHLGPFVIDGTPPETTVDAGPTGFTDSTTASFEFHSSEPSSTFQCRLDAQPWFSCTSPVSYADIPPGTHSFEVRATDSAGNADLTTDGRAFTIDTTAPADPSVTSPSHTPGVVSKDSTVDVAWSGASDDRSGVDGFSYQWSTMADTVPDAVKDAEETSSASTSPVLSHASSTWFHLRTRDNAGNWSSAQHLGPFVIDTVSPDTTLDSGPPTPSTSTSPTFAFHSSEPGSTFTCQLDGSPHPCESPKTYTVSHGNYTFSVRAVDPAGNVDPTASTFGFTVDTTAPESWLTTAPAELSNGNDPAFGFQASEPGATFECRVSDSGWSDWAGCGSPKSYTDVPDGDHTFELRAVDWLGNVEVTTSVWDFTIDTQAPTGPALVSPSHTAGIASADRTVDVSWSGASDDRAGIDGFSYQWSTSAATVPDQTKDAEEGSGATTGPALGDGSSHYFHLRTRDNAGNWSSAQHLGPFVIDTVGPETVIDSGPPTPGNETTAIIAFHSSEGDSTFECRRFFGGPTAEWGTCTSPKTYTGLGDGSHTFEVRARDPLGNPDASPAPRSFTIDTAAPTDPNLSSASHTVGAASNDPTVAVGFSGASDGIAGVDGFSYEWSTSAGTVPDQVKDAEEGANAATSPALGDGSSHYFHLRTRDNAGNWSSTVHLGPFVIDTAPPAEPVLTDTIPASPAGQNDLKVRGSAAAGTTVHLYAAPSASDCVPGSLVGTGHPAAELADPGFDASVANDTTTSFRATATDAAGNASACSASSATYVEDSTAPTDPALSSPSHALSTGSNDPTVDVAFSDASDSLSGVDGFSYEWSTSADTVPDEAKDAEQNAAGTTSPSLADGSSHYFHLRTRDNAGNWSSASHLGPFVIDTLAADEPVLDATAPASPANQNDLKVRGSAPADTTVRLYAAPTTSDCVPANLVQTGSDTVFADPGLDASVADNTTTRFRATATDIASNVSDCSSSSVEYVEDSNAPADPTGLTSPSHTVGVASNDPTVDVGFTGASDALSGVDGFSYEWSTSDSTVPDATKDAEESANSATSAVLTDGSGHYFHLRTRDNAGNWTSTRHLGPFVIDTAPPAEPALTDTVPASPAGQNTLKVRGTAAAGSTARLYAAPSPADCTPGNLVGSPHPAAELSDPGFDASVSDNTTTTFRATATDAAGNVSACSESSVEYAEDSTAPTDPTPTSPSHTPGTPSNDPTVDITWSGASDALSGIDGFSYEWSTSAGTVPDEAKDAEEGANAATSSALADGSSHYFHLRTRDNAGNWSSTQHVGPFVIDTQAPAGPALETDPASPANQNDLKVKGAAEAGSTVALYAAPTASGCTPENLVHSGTAGELADPGYDASVADNTTTTFRATATDAAGNASACAASAIDYVEDSAAPSQENLPELSAPAHPVNTPSNDPTIEVGFSGGSDGLSGLDGYSYEWSTSADTVPDETKDAEEDATGTTSLALPDGTSHYLHVRIVDNAGNWSATVHLGPFLIDTEPPAEPSLDGTDPASPANQNDLKVRGSAAADSSVALYVAPTPADCAPGSLVDGGSAEEFANPGFDASVGNDSTTTFRATATDAAGNTSACSAASIAYDEDSTPPAGPTTLSSASHTPGSASNDTTVDVAWAGASDDRAGVDGYSYEWSASETTVPDQAKEAEEDGGAATSPALADGSSHYFHLRTRDNAGNWSSAQHLGPFVIDTVAPETTIDSAPPTLSRDDSPSFTFHSSKPGSTFECRLDGGAWDTGCGSPKAYSGLADGGHTFEVRAKDPAQNTDPTPDNHLFTIDTEPPATTITFGPAGTTPDVTPTFAFSANEAGASFECKLDGGSFQACTSPRTLDTLAEGAHTFQVAATDQAGNANPAPETRAFTVSIPAPGAVAGWGRAYFGATDTPVGSGFVAIAAGGDHSTALKSDGSIVSWGYDADGRTTPPPGNDFVAISAGLSHNLALRSDGSIAAWGRDNHGQVSGVPAGSDFVAIAAGGFQSLALREDGSIVGWGRNDYGQSTPPAGDDYVAISAGGFFGLALRGDGTIVGFGSDRYGQSTPPSGDDYVAISAGGYNSLALRSDGSIASFGLDAWGLIADAPGGGGHPAISGGLYHSLALASDGSVAGWGNDDYGQATPPAGNDHFAISAGGLHSLALYHDTAPPETTFDSGPSGPTNDNTATFEFSSSEAGSTFQCRLDGGSWVACSSPITTVPQADGPHLAEMRATDHAGNVDPIPAERAFNVDTAAPETVIDSGPAGASNDTTPAYEFHSPDPTATFQCRTDGGAWASCVSPHTTPALPDGPYSFEVRARDSAQNTDPSPASRSVRIDTTAPPKPQITDTDPDSPANDNQPRVKGTTDAGAPPPVSHQSTDVPKAIPDLGSTSSTITFSETGAVDDIEVRIDNIQHIYDTDLRIELIAPDGTAVLLAQHRGGGGEDFIGTVFDDEAANPISAGTAPFTGGFRPEEPLSAFDGRQLQGTWTLLVHDDGVIFHGTLEAWGIDVETAPSASPSTVRLYSGADCSGPVLATGAVGDFAAPGLTPNPAIGDSATASFRATVTDAAGNVSECSDPFGYTEDSTAPETAIDSAPASVSNVNDPVFAFHSSEGGSTFDCRVDGGSWTTGCASPKTYADLADGNRSFEVRARDPLGNTDATPASHPFTIDTAAPVNPALSSPSHSVGAPSSDPTVEASFTAASDGLAGVDGFSYEWSTSSATDPDETKEAEESANATTSSALADGDSHYFHLRTRDNAGNWSTTAHLGPFVIDTQAPPEPAFARVVPYSPGNQNAIKVRGSAEYASTVTLYKATATSDCTPGNQVSSGDSAVFADPGLDASVTDNTTTRFRATVTDAAGNTSACSSAFIDYVEDSTVAAPTFTGTDPPSGSNNNNPRFIGTAEPGSTVWLNTKPDCLGDSLVTMDTAERFGTTGIPISVADNSTTTLYAHVTDLAGNESACSAPITYVETTPIVTPQPSPPPPDQGGAGQVPKRCKKGFKLKKGKCVKKRRKKRRSAAL